MLCHKAKSMFEELSQEHEGKRVATPCTLIKPGNVNSVESRDGWTNNDVMVDTEAHDTVIPPGQLPDIPTKESIWSRLGWAHAVVDEAEVPNEGENCSVLCPRAKMEGVRWPNVSQLK